MAILNTIERDVYILDWIFIDITSEKHYLHEHIHFGGLHWSLKILSATYRSCWKCVKTNRKFFIFNKMEISLLNKPIYSTRTVYMYHQWVCWYSQIKRITQRVVSMKSLNIANALYPGCLKRTRCYKHLGMLVAKKNATCVRLCSN